MAIGNRGGGRPRLPTAVKAMRGTLRPDREPKDEPKPAPSSATAPPSLLAAERRVWNETAPILIANGLLTEADRETLARYCAAMVEWRNARRMIRKTGGPVIVVNGVQQRNQWVKLRDEAQKTLNEIAREFGMTPASRPKLGRAARGAGEDPPPLPRPDAGAAPSAKTFDEFLAAKPH